ncbi:glycoside hydrolase family 18 protein [Endozoicomonas sp. 4G]|uniref:glycosyl hydrolase family 18 protein n=1 Tax=Endozoicomonas sp. 4G TaxID=2872754 RepID=UPI0020791C5E|nr:glycoside hydrolase family 18 protein [Endozoicomonas sp. 4G]
MLSPLSKSIKTICLSLGITAMAATLSGCVTNSSLEYSTAQGSDKVAHFFGIFDLNWDQRLREETPLDKTDLLYIAFAHPYDEDGDGAYELGYENARSGEKVKPGDTDKDRINQLVSAAREKNPGVQILISQGWNQNGYWKAAQNPEVFAESVVSFIRKHGLDGYDMDYEIETDQITLPQFETLAQTVHDHLERASVEDGKDYLFTITPDHTSLRVWNGTLVNSLFDYINLQTYWGDRFHFIDDFKATGVETDKMMIGMSSESYNRPADDPEAFIKVARENNTQGIFAWRMDTDSMDQMGTPHYKITEDMWEQMGRQ